MFNAAIDTFVANAKDAAAAIKDEATFKTEYPKAVRSCGGCHKDERRLRAAARRQLQEAADSQ